MAIGATTASASTSKGQSGSIMGKQSLAETFDNFLVLLTTQLKNQDPTSPMETNEFTNQLVMFTGVEQQVHMNENLESLISLSQNNLAYSSASYIGKTVDAESDQLTVKDGKGDFSFDVNGEATQASVNITTSSGKLVASQTVQLTGERQYIQWDGTDNYGGQAPDGVYKVTVSAVDSNGQAVDTTTYSSGKVTGVEFENGEIMLSLSGNLVPLSKVLSILETPVATTTTAGNS